MADHRQAVAAAWRRNGRALPLLCPARPRRARARLHHASARPHSAALPFRFWLPFFLAAAAAERPQLRRRHSRAQLAPSHSSTTTIAPPSSQRTTASSRARHSRSVSVSAVPMLTGASPRTPSSWPRRHSPPPAPLASALGSPASTDACPRVNLNHHSPHRHTAVVQPCRPGHGRRRQL